MKKQLSPINLILVLVFFISSQLDAQDNPPEGLYMNWQNSEDKRKDNNLNNDFIPHLPTFSYAGYHYGDNPVPTNTSLQVYLVTTSYNNIPGAVANDGKSDKAAIKSAIAAAEANPNGGIVKFPSGKFIVNDASVDNPAEVIKISKSNIIIKGSGSGSGGTELYQKSYTTHPKMKANDWTCPYLFQFQPSGFAYRGSEITSVDGAAAMNTFKVKVASISGLAVNQWIALRLKDYQDNDFIDDEFSPHEPSDLYTSEGTPKIISKAQENGGNKENHGVNVVEYHKVKSIDSSTKVITFYEPILKEVVDSAPWKIYSYNPIEEVGIQDLKYTGGFVWKFFHHKTGKKSLDDLGITDNSNNRKDYRFLGSSGWSGIQFNGVVNGWISNVVFSDMSQPAQFKHSAHSSAINNKLEGNPGHNFITANKSTKCFIAYNDDNSNGNNHTSLSADNSISSYKGGKGAWHGCGVNQEAIGTVLLRNNHATDGYTGIEMHANQPRATLVDKCTGGIFMHAGGGITSIPNHLKKLVIWNFEGAGISNKAMNTDMTPFDPWIEGGRYKTVAIKPIIAGLKGFKVVPSDCESYESEGTSVSVESLYEEQYKYRVEPTANGGNYKETFTNTLGDNSWGKDFKGDNGVSWELSSSVKHTSINYFNNQGRCIYMKGLKGSTAGGEYIKSNSIPGGISSLSVNCKNLFSNQGARSILLDVNGQTKTITNAGITNEEYVATFNNISGITGNFVITIKNISENSKDNSIAFDNITWTSALEDNEAPEISLVGDEIIHLDLGDTYTEEGATATDNLDTILPSDITIGGDTVDTSTQGVYTVTYNVSDLWGNPANEVTRTVKVVKTYNETFSGLTVSAVNSENWLTNKEFNGDEITWHLTAKKVDGGHAISGKGIYFQRGKTGIVSENLTDVCSFSVECKSLWNLTNERKIELYLNNEFIDSKTFTGSQVEVFSVPVINKSGTYTISLKNASSGTDNNTISIDNIKWTSTSPLNSNKSSVKVKTHADINADESLFKTNISPNPFTADITIKLSKEFNEMILFDIVGRVIEKRKINKGEREIILSLENKTKAKGVYILKLINEKVFETHKLIRN